MPNTTLTNIDFHAQALSLRSERQRVLASNIANADTPGFQARDFRFSDALQAATGMSGSTVGMAKTSSSHLQGMGGAAGVPNLLYVNPTQQSMDGNTVDMDRERANFADNSVRYEASLQFINSSMRKLLSAITGQ